MGAEAGVLRDAWRLAVGTLTVLRVAPPVVVDRRRAGLAMVLAPLAVAPLGVLVALVAWGAVELDVAPLVTGMVVVGVLTLGTRALHLDGLADLADGLTASYDRERSLAVMKTGTAGPAGVAALVIVLGLQAAAAGSLLASTGARGALVVGVATCASRAALSLCCLRGVPGARADGLGSTYVGSVAPMLTLLVWILAAVVAGVAVGWAGVGWWHGPLAVALALAAVCLVVLRAVRRLGGVTGDVFGACVEIAFAVVLVGVPVGAGLG